MSNEATVAASIAALFAYELESFKVGRFTIALGAYRGEERVRVCGEREDPNSAGSHTVCAEGDDYDRAARWLVDFAAANAERAAL